MSWGTPSSIFSQLHLTKVSKHLQTVEPFLRFERMAHSCEVSICIVSILTDIVSSVSNVSFGLFVLLDF